MSPGTVLRFWVYWGNPAASGALANPSNVWLFADGLESGASEQVVAVDGRDRVDGLGRSAHRLAEIAGT